MMKQLTLAGLLLALTTPLAAAADEGAMINACRSYAASHLNADAGVINVSGQTARVDGTIPSRFIY
jgi:hypothetical protein